MFNRRIGAIVFMLMLGCIFTFQRLFIAHAQTQTVPTNQEAVTAFQSVVTVNLDNSVNIRELITYATGPQERHGIYRDIYPYSSEGRLMDINNISVTDGSGNPYQWQKLSNGSDVRIKIGDPNVTFNGTRNYLLTYTATNAVAHPKDVDEIYWNATGNDWLIPVYNAQAVIYLPKGVEATQFACYYGQKGSTSKCERGPYDTYSFASPSVLNPGEGLTVAVGFLKGIIPPYSSTNNLSNFWQQYLPWFIALLLPLITFVIMFSRWRKVGRDPKDDRTIIPEYDVPDGLTPFEVSCILNQKIKPTDISAEIIYLATKGYLKVKYIENKIIGFIKTTDYEFEVLKDYSDLTNQFDLKLLYGIFSTNTAVGTTAKLSDLKNKFYKNIPIISDSVVDSMLAKGYYSNLKKSNEFSSNWSGKSFVALIFYVFIALISFGITGNTLQNSNLILFIGSVVTSVIIFSIFSHIMPAKTEKGVLTKDYILGLKLYLQIAERDRLQFHNAPEKKPEIFEKLLPFAMVLGVNDSWAKEFEGIVTTPPNWYEGYPVGTGVFSPIAFNNNLSSFGAATSTSMGSAPGGGGSGGGGFSGGGGGGGGGGGW